jgi:DnaJ-class molecular chaperone
MAMVECAWCQGKGVDDTKLDSPCNVCGGDGYVSVPDPPTRCGRCEGTGRIRDGVSQSQEKCSGCGGSGWAS